MKTAILLLLALAFSLPCRAGEETGSKPDSWWKQRRQRSDLLFPHNAHLAVMEQRGDLCLACHPFSATPDLPPDQVRRLEPIANEPLKAICHQCHLAERSAPIACRLCHPDSRAIRPADHSFDYRESHAEPARQDESACQQCHLDLGFCTDCHFRRNSAQRHQHRLGYRLGHGLDARIDPASCGGCHNAGYCRDCHRGGR